MSRKYKVDEVLAELSVDERAEYDALSRQPASTIDDLMQWLFDHDCKVSRGAVWKHRRNFQDTLDGVRKSAELARAFADVAREGGIESLGEASLARFQQLMTEKLLRMNEDEELDASELMKLSIAMNSAASTRQRIESVKAEYAKRQVEAVKQAEQAVQAGSSGQTVVDTIKRALGITE